MRYIAALDYEHLDNGVFLTTLARSLSQQQSNKDVRSIIIHGDSAYTERIIQTGVMRDEATVRSVKDLNNRLVALFADEGVSAVGINPFQRNFITLKEDQLTFDHSFYDTLPHQSVLLLSTLVYDTSAKKPVVVDLSTLAQFLSKELDADQLFIFSKSDESEIFTNSDAPTNIKWDSMDPAFRKKQIPDELRSLNRPVQLVNARDFNQIPDLKHAISIQ